MTIQTLPARLRWTRAEVVIDDVPTWVKARLVLAEGVVRVFERTGDQLAEGTVVEGTRVSARELRLTVQRGDVTEQWVATQAGCGCGSK